MAPITKLISALSLLASTASAGVIRRDLVTEVLLETATDMTYVTQFVTVIAGNSEASATSDLASPSAATPTPSFTPASRASAQAFSGARFHSAGSQGWPGHSFGGQHTWSHFETPRPATTLQTAASSPSAVAQETSEAPSTSTQRTSHVTHKRTSTIYASSAAPTSKAPVSQTPASQAPSSAASAATSAASPSSPSAGSPSSSSGKRGLAFNQASLTSMFSGSKYISWAYNWGSSASGLGSSLEYVPLLWSDASSHTNSWNSDATKALSSGTTHLMSFNEPDLPAQANMSPEAAAAAYKQYMQPFASKAKLGSPAVTNGGGSMGLTWLKSFQDACTSCQIDFVPIHWYDSATNVAYFKQHIQQAHEQSGKPVWVTEFGATGSDAQIADFLNEVMPWMDSQDYVERYAYFMAGQGTLISGSALSSYGKVYASS